MDIRNSDCTYKFLYKVADTFDRVVDIYIEIDFIFNDITAQIVIAKSPLLRFVAALPKDAEDK